MNEDQSLKLLTPVPEERLNSWLAEFYGHPIKISEREVLRHRDLSYVERIWVANSLPASLIYKLVLPPWDIELDILERVLIPSISSSPQLYLSAHHENITALFLEDLGNNSLKQSSDVESACILGKDLAKLHRSYIYRIDELVQAEILRTITPIDYVTISQGYIEHLANWSLLKTPEDSKLAKVALTLATNLASEPISLVHGDFYAENIIRHNDRLRIIDWSWFTFIGIPIYDLATITALHKKNGGFFQFKNQVIESYCDESARQVKEVKELLPYAYALSDLLFLGWLIERKVRGIEGTTVGPVDDLILQVVQKILSFDKTMGYT